MRCYDISQHKGLRRRPGRPPIAGFAYFHNVIISSGVAKDEGKT